MQLAGKDKMGKMSRKVWLTTSLLIFVAAVHVQSANILFALSASSRSHKNIMDPIMVGLLKKGHNVTVLSQFSSTENPAGVTTVQLTTFRETITRISKEQNFFTMSNMSSLEFLINLNDNLVKVAGDTFGDPVFTDFIKAGHHFDIVAIDGVINDHLLALGFHFGAPTVLISSNHLFQPTSWNLDIPLPPSVHPNFFFTFPVPMAFIHRLLNSFALLLGLWNRHFLYHPPLQKVVDLHFPEAPPLLELEKNVSFIFTNTFPSLTGPEPSMPYLVEIGGIHCHPPNELNSDLQRVISASGENGFIIFSLGSATQGTLIPEDFRQKLLKVFASLNQTILWKFEGKMPDAPENVKLLKWLPQQDLLGHPMCKLFITHGGLLSIQEAVYHAVPTLVIPLAGDQFANAFRSEQQGFADIIHWNDFSVEEAVNKINALLGNIEHKRNVEKQSKLFRDRPMDVVDNSVYWMEYVIRTGGAQHLKSKAGELSFVQYFLLDVIALTALVLAAIFAFIFFFVYRILRFLKSRFCGRHADKPQTKIEMRKKET